MMPTALAAPRSTAPRPTLGFLICLPLLLSFAAPVAEHAYAQEPATGDAPEDIWSEDYINDIFLGLLKANVFCNSKSTTPTTP